MKEDIYNPVTLIQVVDEGLNNNPNKVLLATKSDGKWLRISPGQFKQRVREFALGLYELGVRKGDKVTLHAENSANWLIVDQAILSIGAVNVPIHVSQNSEEVIRIIEHCDAKVHIFSKNEQFDEIKEQVQNELPKLIIISLNEETSLENAFTFREVLEKGVSLIKKDEHLFDQLIEVVTPDDIATIVYTLGAEGISSGVMLTHNNIASNIWGSLDSIPFDIDLLTERAVLSYLPLSHIFERLVVYIYLYLQLPVYFIEKVEEIIEDLKTIRPIHFSTVPRLLEKIYSGIWNREHDLKGWQKRVMDYGLELAEQYDVEQPFKGLNKVKYYIADKIVYSKMRESVGGQLIAITSGGAPLSARLMNFVNALGIHCGQGYGLTEASPVLTAYRPHELRAGSVGKPLKNVEIKIEEDGEILARGPNIMKGYYKNPGKTSHAITRDNWLKTGDLGYFDNDGYLYITGRKKELIKLSTGKYVAPANIEIALERSAFIEQAAIIGYGEKFCAALIYPDIKSVKHYFNSKNISIPDENYTNNSEVYRLIESEIAEVNKYFADWEQVKQFRLMHKPMRIEDGELTRLYKKKRHIIQNHYKELINSIYD
jgi:long-chain acyl-CoA synthetase